MQLPSDLWLDQLDAHDRIEQRRADGRIDEARAELLHGFIEDGFARVQLDLDPDFTARFDADVERVWAERPPDLAVSPPGFDPPTAFRDYDGPFRPVGYRIPDLHGTSDAARALFLDPLIFDVIECIFDQPAVAFQSLYFEFGSRQGLHRDPMFVPTRPVSHLLASWTALEDISASAGPLEYIRRSHRLPWFEFEPGSVARLPTAPPDRLLAWNLGLAALRRSTPPERFTARRGETFIWHAGLFHGGAPIEDPRLTRKSFVVHYSTLANYRERRAQMRIRKGDGWTSWRRSTSELLASGNRRGLASPFAGHEPGNR